jgi:TetR/AcrR family transcriptional repressor of nem operon
MPRVSRAQAEEHREAITEEAARLFRERGIKAVSVADLMSAAGLTHGGFYGHFESKDALAGIASARAFSQATERWRKRAQAQGTPAAQRAAIVEGYLKPQNVRDVACGCPTAALCVDVAREPAGAPVRAAYLAGLEDMVRILAATEPAGDGGADRRAALADYATMLGAMLMARATNGAPIADEIIAAARERLLPAAPAPTSAPRVRARRSTAA